MFERRIAPPRPDVSTNDQLPDDWAVLAVPVDVPGPAAWVEVKRRDALVAVVGGGWHHAVVWHWSWTTDDPRPVWSAQVEYQGVTAWYLWEEDRIRLDPLRRGYRG
jgi:hypothetical protein